MPECRYVSMATVMRSAPVTRPPAARIAAVLTSGCDGYPAGSTGAVTGRRDGCLVFAPDRPDVVARWAYVRRELLVPPSFVVTVR